MFCLDSAMVPGVAVLMLIRFLPPTSTRTMVTEEGAYVLAATGNSIDQAATPP